MSVRKHRISLIIAFVLSVLVLILPGIVEPVSALSKNDFKNDPYLLYVQNGNYYFMHYAPPSKYGKEFGKASDYTASPKTEVLYSKTWSKSSESGSIISKVKSLYKTLRPSGPRMLLEIAKQNVKGVKVTRTITYNKNTKQFKVGKNKSCRKEVWKLYFREKNTKTGKYAWRQVESIVGYYSIIRL